MDKVRVNKLLISISIVMLVILSLGVFSFAEGKEPTAKKTEIILYTWPVGTTAYLLTHALSEKINKTSSWLRVSPVAYSTPTEGIMNMQSMKDKSMVIVGTDAAAAIRGLRPYPKPMSSIRGVANLAHVSNPFATLDPNVKGCADLKGKRVTSTSPAAASVYIWEACFERCGVKPGEYKIEYMSYTKGVEALKAGMVDAISIGSIYLPKKHLLLPIPAIAELMSRETVYFVPYEAEDVDKVIKEKGLFGISFVHLPPGGLKGSNQPVWTYALSIGFYCDSSLDSRIITEFLTIFYNNFDELKVGIPAYKNLSRESMGAMFIPKEYWHPTALGFMEEHNISIK